MKHILLSFIPLLFVLALQGQIVEDFIDDESDLYAATKQVNQFFRRFNGEEDTKGVRYYPGDRMFRNAGLRKAYLENLFNNENPFITPALKESFIGHITDSRLPVYLEFHGGSWFAEVTTTFSFQGAEKYLTLFLQLEKDTIGSKWVITNVFFEPFAKVFADQDSLRTTGQKFLHPMSHELDFMNLVRAFEQKESLEHYVAWKYHPDYLTLFIYEYKRGNLVFKTVSRVKFHFFQIDGWYFEIGEFNRKGYNTGWLISNLMKISPEEKDILMKYIYHE
ncbi:MAG: hypothetical protein R6W71_05735 [Bacteroidales bacterium]|jgi:hypothetical protein